MQKTIRLRLTFVYCVCAAVMQCATNSYTQTNLDSTFPGNQIGFTVPTLVNPWGFANFGGPRAGSSWFIADNGTGRASLIMGNGDWGSDITITPASGSGVGSPAGVCVSPGHTVTFATLDGTISDFVTGSKTTIEINNSARGAVYTACTRWGPKGPGERIYVANSAGGVEAYDSSFSPVTLPPGAFVDPSVPAGFTPYGIWSNSQIIWVSFYNGIPGQGQGYIDAFDENGALLFRLQQGPWMNQPFGMAKAPANFGRFSKALLVAMTGSGMIAAFNPQTGSFGGVLADASGHAIVIPGIHGIGFGNGAEAGPTNSLFFAAGIDGFTQGLFGTITAN